MRQIAATEQALEAAQTTPEPAIRLLKRTRAARISRLKGHLRDLREYATELETSKAQ